MQTEPLPLQTRVLYDDQPGVIVARCKPVGINEPYRYDILLGNRIEILVSAERFVTQKEIGG